MATGDVFAVKLHMVFAEQQCRPGFYLVEGTGVGDPSTTNGCAVFVRSILGTDSLAGFSAALAMTAIEVQDVQPGSTRTTILATGTTTGTVADDNPVPPQDSMLIEWVTALKGGKGLFARRGRSYIPGIYSTGQISGFLTAGLQDALSAFASLIFDAFVSDGTVYQMHAVSFTPNSKPRTIREIHPIATFGVDNVVAVQRSRRPGRGI